MFFLFFWLFVASYLCLIVGYLFLVILYYCWLLVDIFFFLIVGYWLLVIL